jgi:hypothetical protein
LSGDLVLPLIFAAGGFIISFLLSLIARNSIGSLFLKSTLSALILGGLGYIFQYFIKTFSSEENIDSENTKKANPDNGGIKTNDLKTANRNLKEKYSDDYSSAKNEASSVLSEPLENQDISYESLFAKLDDNDSQKTMADDKSSVIEDQNFDIKSDDNSKNSFVESVDNNDETTDSRYKEKNNFTQYNRGDDFIKEIKKEADESNVALELDGDIEVIEGDSDFSNQQVSAEEAAKIAATSKASSISGEVKSIDDKYIYFTKGARIENKPEKIAKVIKQMIEKD